ncbi:sialate O-acetylesterase [Verrucomicrobiota bacterium]
MRHLYIITLAALLAAASANGAEQGKHLFILSGQSNMAGLDPEISFTPTVIEAFGKDNVIVVKDAQGGQPIRRWYKKWKPAKGTEPKADGKLYDRLMEKVKEAVGQKKSTSITFVWMQGERDAKENHHEVYADGLKGLVQQLRDDLGFKNINVVIGRLSDARSGKGGWDAIRKIQKDVCEADPLWDWVDTDDLNGEKNGVHYSKEGYKELGKRFAEKAINLIKKSK